jgi:hypothetical protein
MAIPRACHLVPLRSTAESTITVRHKLFSVKYVDVFFIVNCQRAGKIGKVCRLEWISYIWKYVWYTKRVFKRIQIDGIFSSIKLTFSNWVYWEIGYDGVIMTSQNCCLCGPIVHPRVIAMWTMVWWYWLGLTPNSSTRLLWQPPVLSGGPASRDISSE